MIRLIPKNHRFVLFHQFDHFDLGVKTWIPSLYFRYGEYCDQNRNLDSKNKNYSPQGETLGALDPKMASICTIHNICRYNRYMYDNVYNVSNMCFQTMVGLYRVLWVVVIHVDITEVGPK